MKNRYLCCLCLVLAGCGSHSEPESPKPLVDVKVTRVTREDLRAQVRAPATVFGRQQANIAARITAPIRRLLVRKGDLVAAGQVLAELEDRDLLAQRAEARAAVADAEATLEKLTAGSLPTDIERARGQLAVAEAAFRQAQKIYERRKALYEEGAIPARELLISETELAQARANYEVARTQLDLLKQQTRERDIRIAQSRLEQAKARLAYIESQLEFTRLRSPFAGTITEQFMFPGDMAKPDAPVFAVADLSVAVARAQVPEAEAGPVAPGQDCSFESVDEPGRRFAGRISIVNRAVDPQSRRVEAWCEIPNSDRKIRAGAFGEVAITTRIVRQALVVPLSAVEFEEGSDRGVARVVSPQRTVMLRPVEAGLRGEGKVQVLRGLNEGELVIIEAGYGLAEGTPVRFEGGTR